MVLYTLGPLNVYVNCIAFSVGLTAVGSGPVPASWSSFWEPIRHAGIPHLALMKGEKLGTTPTWSAFLMPTEGLED